MNVNLGDAVGAVGLSLNVITDFFRELLRIGVISARLEFDRDVGGQTFHVIVLLDTPIFEMVTSGPDSPRTRLHLTGTIEAHPVTEPDGPATTFPLDAAVRLTVVLVSTPGSVAKVGFRYDGVDGMPTPPITVDDINSFMMSAEVQAILTNTRLPIADSLIQGLNQSLFDEETRPAATDWVVQLTLTPAGEDTVDAFVVSVGPPGTSAAITTTESFVALQTELGVAYNRQFLDLLLGWGAQNKIGTTVDGGKVVDLNMVMVGSGSLSFSSLIIVGNSEPRNLHV